jgi:hypothetical protein
MSLSESDIQGFIEKNPYNAFGLICTNNDTLNYVRAEDVQAYERKRVQYFRLKTASAIAGGALFGIGSAKLIRAKGILKGVAVGYLTLVGFWIGQQAGDAVTAGNQRSQEDIIRRYPDFKTNPKVIAFLQNRSFRNSKTL